MQNEDLPWALTLGALGVALPQTLVYIGNQLSGAAYVGIFSDHPTPPHLTPPQDGRDRGRLTSWGLRASRQQVCKVSKCASEAGRVALRSLPYVIWSEGISSRRRCTARDLHLQLQLRLCPAAGMVGRCGRPALPSVAGAPTRQHLCKASRPAAAGVAACPLKAAGPLDEPGAMRSPVTLQPSATAPLSHCKFGLHCESGCRS